MNVDLSRNMLGPQFRFNGTFQQNLGHWLGEHFVIIFKGRGLLVVEMRGKGSNKVYLKALLIEI